MDGPDNPKLLELRAKTDSQLQALISHRLDLGLTFAAQNGNGRAQAQHAYRDASKLLPLVGPDAAKRNVLEAKFRLLGRMLDQSSSDVGCASCLHMPA